MKAVNDRLKAVQVLTKLLKNNFSLSQAFASDHAISPLAKAICFGVCRQYYRLQSIAQSLMPKRQKSPVVWVVLLVGLYQLLYLEKPSYAAVKETVDVLDRLHLSWAKGFINAILRTFCRDRDTILAELKLTGSEEFIYGHPAWLLQAIKADWPLSWAQIVVANDEHPPMSLRVNLNKITREEYLKKLNTAGLDAEVQRFSSAGLTLHTACSVQELPDFARGEVSLQDEAAQLAASLLQLKPGLRVLDACCAPGGKTCHILEWEPTLKECVALDISESRLLQVRENLTRLSLHATVKQGDAATPAAWWDGQLFDRILLDAPCSAVGVIRRHPDIKLLRTLEEIEQAVLTQHALLRSVWPLLCKGGVMVYATCSILRRENEQQIARFIEEHPECEILVSHYPWGHFTGQGWQILPGEGGCDGFFYSVLSKKIS